MAYTKLISRQTSGANIEEITPDAAYRLSIPARSTRKYRLAQLDDYPQLRRSRFLWRFPLTLSLSARTSSESIPGTWGFGLWNDPFGLSLGFGGSAWRLPALPNAVWFFSASKESYLSFRDASTTGFDAKAPQPSAQRDVVGHGFLAQTFRSPSFHPLLIPAGIALPFSRKFTRRLLARVIGEDATRLSVDVTQWHNYRLDWRENGVAFTVDHVQVFESPTSPRPPLGLVIWIDNQYAAFTPEGKIGFGVLENPEPAWLEVRDIDVKSL